MTKPTDAIEAAARAMCKFDGLDPDEFLPTGAIKPDFRKRWEMREFAGRARAALSATDGRKAQKGIGDELCEVVREAFKGDIAAAITRHLTNGERYIVQPLSTAQAQQEKRDARMKKAAFTEAARIAYLVCAGRCHVTLADKVFEAIRKAGEA